MRLTVVGCSGSFPGPRSAGSCYLVEHDGFRLVVDLGNGSLGALARHVDILTVDAVLISHLHVDHYVDLCSYYVARRYDPHGPPPPVPVYGPTGTAEQVARAYGGTRSGDLAAAFAFADLRPEFELGPFRVAAARVAHPVEAYGLRLAADGQVLAYSGDTGPTDALVDLARDCDLLLAEASFLEGAANPPDLHLTGRDAGEIATRADAGRVVLTHVPPWHDPQRALEDCAPAYGGEITLAEPGLAISL